MDLRLGLLDLAHAHRLDARGARELHRLAGLHEAPQRLAHRLAIGVAVLAAALIGLGVVFWIAAHWDDLGRAGRFALLQGFVAAMCLGAAARPAARAPLSLLALLGVGALFAYFGQTYQTGADPWQLFALWAALALPLALAARSDVIWAPWAVVAMTAVALWVQANTGHRWRFEPQDLAVHAIGWAGAAGVVGALGAWPARFTGAGAWARRTAVTLMVALVTVGAVGALFGSGVAPQYWLALAVLAAAAALHARRQAFDIYAVSATSLGLNAVLVGGMAHALLQGAGSEPVGALFIVGIAAAGLLAATVTLILRLARAREAS